MDSISLSAVLTMAIIGVVLSFGGAYLISFLRSPGRAVEGPEVREERERLEQQQPLQQTAQQWMEQAQQQQRPFQQQAQHQQQAFQEMTQEVMNTYAQLLRSAQFPIEGYDELTVEEVSGRLDGLSAEELRVVRDYEECNKNRVTILEQLDRRIRGKLRSEAAEHAQQMREEVVNQLNASVDARFNDLLVRVEEGLTAHAVAQAAANRYSFWLSCGANFVFFVLGAIASAVTTLVLG